MDKCSNLLQRHGDLRLNKLVSYIIAHQFVASKSFDLASHVLNFVHALAVLLNSVHFVSVLATYLVNRPAVFISFGFVLMCIVHKTLIFVVGGALTMGVRRENDCESVSHL